MSSRTDKAGRAGVPPLRLEGQEFVLEPPPPEVVSETSTERHEREVGEARRVWFSGYLTGRSYAPMPTPVNTHHLDDATRERLLAEKVYLVPRGYRYHTHNLPVILKREPTGRLLMSLFVYIGLASVALIFLLIAACPVPWFRGRDVTIDGVNYRGVQYTLWRQHGGALPTLTTADLRICPLQKQFYQAIAASTILGCCFALFSIVAAVARVLGKGSYGWTLLFGFLALAWALAGNAMSISQLHLDNCRRPRLVHIAHLDAGFALTLLAWLLLLVALLLLACVTRLNVGPVLKTHRTMDTYYFIAMLVALLFTVVANATTVWRRRFAVDASGSGGGNVVHEVRVTYWHTEVLLEGGVPLIYGRAMYRCSAYSKRMKASVSFLILGSVALFLAALLAIRAHIKRNYRIAATALGILASVFLIISWVTAVAVFYRTSCTAPVTDTAYAAYPGVPSGVYEGRTSFPGYHVQEGVALVIVAWLLCTGAVILNFMVPWDNTPPFWAV